jgi:hypothetical protein
MGLIGPIGRTYKSYVSHKSYPIAGPSAFEDEYELPLFRTSFLFLYHRHSLADLAPAGKIPGIGKAGALIGFYRVDSAVLFFKEDTTPIGILLKSQTVPLWPQTSETLNKFVLRTLQKAGDR